MNSFQWGGATKSFREKGVERYVARKADGSTLAHTYNKFTENPLVPVCLSQDFWHETYSGLCDTVINSYGCSGVYMDQTCNNYVCYNPDHGHTVGGGNYWVKGHLKMIERIREKTSANNPILTGEGSGEDWIAHLDGFLTLEGSRERMRGTKASEIIPLFNAVYHGYAICFGNLVKRRIRYHSKPRPDLPEDCPEIIRYDELRKMWFYPGSERNRVLSYMIRYPKKEMHTFYTLKAANQWLGELEKKTLEDKENS
jgi:hypothetical protein